MMVSSMKKSNHAHTYYIHAVVFVHEKFVKKPIEEENAEIELPNEVVKGGVQGLKMASFFFKNMSGQLPDSVNNTDSNRLVTALI